MNGLTKWLLGGVMGAMFIALTGITSCLAIDANRSHAQTTVNATNIEHFQAGQARIEAKLDELLILRKAGP